MFLPSRSLTNNSLYAVLRIADAAANPHQVPLLIMCTRVAQRTACQHMQAKPISLLLAIADAAGACRAYVLQVQRHAQLLRRKQETHAVNPHTLQCDMPCDQGHI